MTKRIQGLYAIADNTFRPEFSQSQLAERYLEGGARIVQLRMKRAQGPETRDQGLKIMKLKKKHDFTFIVNDRVDIALEVGADGVHVGRDDLPIAEVRRKIGSNMLIGYSSHSLEEAIAAEKAGADYVAFGAIFKSPTKGPGHPMQGLKKLREVVQAIQIPVVAIGGINRNNFQNVLEIGVASFAMISALTDAKDIAEATKFFMSFFAPSTKY